jgi:serine/threonine protein phosphatase PrpC
MSFRSDELFDAAAATHVGNVRTQNEDSFITRTPIGLWAVADGMGGHEAGGLASAAVVDSLRKIPPPEGAAEMLRACEDSMVEANAAIRAIAAARGFEVIGTTVVILMIFGRHFACLWAGDSRVYRLRQGVISQITRDHSEAQELIERGLLSPEEAKGWSRRNVITRAIGVFEEPELELQHGEVDAGDVFILCSDGLTGHVDAEEIAASVAKSKAKDSCARLVDLTLERGAQDNVTVVVVRYKPDDDTVVLPADGERELDP